MPPDNEARNRNIAVVAIAVVCLLGALIVGPMGDEHTQVFGIKVPSTCSFKAAMGLPCPGCGMTRSWVWLARGQPSLAMNYNIGGATLLLAIEAAGLLGLIRLITGRQELLRMSSRMLVALMLFWATVLVSGVWVLRLMGYLPTPPGL